MAVTRDRGLPCFDTVEEYWLDMIDFAVKRGQGQHLHTTDKAVFLVGVLAGAQMVKDGKTLKNVGEQVNEAFDTLV